MAKSPPSPSGDRLGVTALPRRRSKRSHKSAKRRHAAKLPPAEPGGPCEIRYYETKARARAAQRSAWSQRTGQERRRKASKMAAVERAQVRQNSVNSTEAGFLEWLARERPSAAVQRCGWPDFLVEHRGQTVAIEVKSAQDSLSADQIRMMSFLERAGVPCYVWQRERLVPFLEFLREQPRDAPWCSSGQASLHKIVKSGSDSDHANLASDDRTPGVPIHSRLSAEPPGA